MLNQLVNHTFLHNFAARSQKRACIVTVENTVCYTVSEVPEFQSPLGRSVKFLGS